MVTTQSTLPVQASSKILLANLLKNNVNEVEKENNEISSLTRDPNLPKIGADCQPGTTQNEET